MLDIHSHILFGVDDGSDSFQESQQMLVAARKAGIDYIVCTPHCRNTRFDPDLIAANYAQLKRFADSQMMPMTLGYEVHWRMMPELGIEAMDNLVIDGTDLLLLEFSIDQKPSNWERVLYHIQSRGIRVIIAHPERYVYVQKKPAFAEELKEAGCLLQLSANFAEGGMFSPSHRCAVELLRRGLVDYIASDAHCPEHYAAVPAALKIARRY